MMSHRETHDNYQGELFRYGIYRVAECSDGIQWLVQKRRGTEWRSLSYCTTKTGLELDWRRHTGNYAPEIAILPERFCSTANLTNPISGVAA